jgi:hypothetical protein
LLQRAHVEHALSLDLIFSTAYPAMAAVAGLVPCAESGIRIFLRGLPRFSSSARISRMPVSSPCAPAAGCSVTASMPVISASAASMRAITSIEPCASASG